MKGLELSKEFFEEIGHDLFKKEAGHIFQYLAFGLVGEGSECFMLDDDISKDHDFGPGFCVWLPQKYYDMYGSKLEEIYRKLPGIYKGYKTKDAFGPARRVGIFSIEDFYERYTGKRSFPLDIYSWLSIPESYLATATNGEVFLDNLGEFSKIRSYLLDFYPSDIQKKKLASYLFSAGQGGQYNMSRTLERKDMEGYYLSKYEFIKGLYGSLYLLAHEYMPYYKLVARKLRDIHYYPEDLLDDIRELQSSSDPNTDIVIVERLSAYVAKILSLRYGINYDDRFLVSSANRLQAQIEDRDIRSLPVMKGN